MAKVISVVMVSRGKHGDYHKRMVSAYFNEEKAKNEATQRNQIVEKKVKRYEELKIKYADKVRCSVADYNYTFDQLEDEAKEYLRLMSWIIRDDGNTEEYYVAHTLLLDAEEDEHEAIPEDGYSMKIIKEANDFFGIASPSKLFMEIAKD